MQVACDDIDILDFYSGGLLVDRLMLKFQYTSSSDGIFIMKYPMQGLFATMYGCLSNIAFLQIMYIVFLQMYISGGGEGNFS